MKITLLIIFSSFCIAGCKINAPKYVKQNFHKEIVNGRVRQSFYRSKGALLIVYDTGTKYDSIFVGGYGALYKYIDSFAILNKKANSYDLQITNLKSASGGRQSENLLLIY